MYMYMNVRTFLSLLLLCLAAGWDRVIALAVPEEPELCSAVVNSEYQQVLRIVQDVVVVDTQEIINGFCPTGETPLMIASRGPREIVELLVVQGNADANIRSRESGDTALMIASNEGNFDVVNLLLKKGKANVNLQKTSGATALMLASFAGHVEVVRALLAGGANVNIQEAQGNSAILLASMAGYLDVVQVLIAEGQGDESIPNRAGWTALHGAVKGGHMAIAEYLLERRPQSAKVLNKDGYPLLYTALLSGHVGMMKLLLTKYNADGSSLMAGVNMTPLQIASREGDIDLVDMLLSEGYVSGAAINTQNSRGFSALHMACEVGTLHDLVMTRLLKEEMIDVNLQNNEGTTPLMLAAARGSLNQVVALVSTDRVDASIRKTASNRTALHFACANGHTRIVYFLINGVAVKDINSQELRGWTALSFASYLGYPAIVSTLLEDRRDDIDVNRLAFDGSSSLILATQQGHANIVQMLLTHGANPNVQKINDGFSALMRASYLGYEAIVTLLLAVADIEVNLSEADGWTALMFASHKGHASIVLDLLAMKDINVDAQTYKEGATAVMLACQQQHMTIVSHLIEKGNANLLLATKDGRDAKAFCSQSGGMKSSVELIESRSAEQKEKTTGKWAKYKASRGGYHEKTGEFEL